MGNEMVSSICTITVQFLYILCSACVCACEMRFIENIHSQALAYGPFNENKTSGALQLLRYEYLITLHV